MPRDLVESNLFGHERGAFTGALRQQLGKFELAAGDTLFLDEIADLGLDLQAKLLRAIQEGEIERVGGTKPIKTEFRLVMATNVDLDRAVKEGKFRDDLYYRINVQDAPPLRERAEDIPELVQGLKTAEDRTWPVERRFSFSDPLHARGSELQALGLTARPVRGLGSAFRSGRNGVLPPAWSGGHRRPGPKHRPSPSARGRRNESSRCRDPPAAGRGVQ